MKRQKENKSQRIVIFVEGDTDEVFFKALLEYYKSVSRTELVPCDVCNLKGVTRYTSKLLAKLKNDILPDALPLLLTRPDMLPPLFEARWLKEPLVPLLP